MLFFAPGMRTYISAAKRLAAARILLPSWAQQVARAKQHLLMGKFLNIFFYVGKGANDGKASIKERLARPHSADITCAGQIQEKGLYDVIHMVPQGKFITALFFSCCE